MHLSLLTPLHGISYPSFLNFNVLWAFIYVFFFWYYNAVKNGSKQNNGRKIKLKEIWKLVIAALECSEHWGPQGQARTENNDEGRQTLSEWGMFSQVQEKTG